jgi:hypothetical protein
VNGFFVAELQGGRCSDFAEKKNIMLQEQPVEHDLVSW